MKDDEKPAPDFAMQRAVEVLAKLVENVRFRPVAQPKPLDRPVVLFNEAQIFALGKTRRADVQKTLGAGFPYPYKGWASWGVAGNERKRWLLSAMYQNDVLMAVEHYMPKTDGQGPLLDARSLGSFRFVPGDVRLGMPITSLAADYVFCETGPGAVVYDQTFQALFAGGIALVMANAGVITRLALYASR